MDIPNAIEALQNDTLEKAAIIERWQITQEDSMEDYYNRKLSECEIDMRWNNDMAETLMATVKEYHESQMYPTITDLSEMAKEMVRILDNIVNGAEMSAYAGEVDEMVTQIDDLANEAKNKLNTIQEMIKKAFVALCVAMSSLAAAAGICLGLRASAQSAIEAVIDEAKDIVDDISITAETPPIDASTTQTAASVDNEVSQEGEYTPSETSGAQDYPMEAGNSQQDTSEDINFVDGFDLSLLEVFFQFTHVWYIVSFIDLIIIYRRIIIIIKRIIQFQQGRKVVQKSEYFVENNVRTNCGQRLLKLKMFFGFVGYIKDFIFQDLLPLSMVCI